MLHGDHGHVSATHGVEVPGLRILKGDAADIEGTEKGKWIFCYENIFLCGWTVISAEGLEGLVDGDLENKCLLYWQILLEMGCHTESWLAAS